MESHAHVVEQERQYLVVKRAVECVDYDTDDAAGHALHRA